MPKIFIPNNPTAPRLCPQLAQEIGLNESIMLLQIEFWVSVIGEKIDDTYWVRRSLSDIKETFPFWSRQTISRVLTNLELRGLVDITDEYNEWDRDKTRWYSINEDGCSKLESIAVIRVKSKAGSVQNETTLHSEYYYSNNIPKNAQARLSVSEEDAERQADSWASTEPRSGERANRIQPYLISVKPKKKPRKIGTEPILATHHKTLYRICYLAETQQEALTLTSQQRGRVASVLGKLREAGADLGKLALFEDWWKVNWRSRDKFGEYQAPRPEQVLEFWWASTKPAPSKERIIESKPLPTVPDLETRMMERAKQRNND